MDERSTHPPNQQSSSSMPCGNVEASTPTAAHKVFRTTELLEKVLLDKHVGVIDLFNAAAVSRTWKSTFEGSKSLQVKAQLEADMNAECFVPCFHLPGGLTLLDGSPIDILITRHMSYGDRVSKLYFDVFYILDYHGPIRITPNLRRCLATQPPCKTMVARPRCCGDGREKITNETGITLDEIISTSTRMYKEHEHCPEMAKKIAEHAGESDWDQSRYPRFSGDIQLPEDSKLRMREVQKRAKRKQRMDKMTSEMEQAGWSSTWYEYRKARREATSNGEDLPRWPEFLAKHPRLVPAGYELNQSEAEAAARQRILASSDGSIDRYHLRD